MKSRKFIIIAAAIALVAVCIAAFFAVRTYTVEPPRHLDIDRNKYPIKGIDISAHNGSVDFEAAAADSIAFVYVKATEGASFRDSMFCANYAAAQKAGLPTGIYHFFRFDCSGASQADNLLAALDTFPLPNLPVVIDLEEWGNPETDNTQAIVREILAMVRCLNYNNIRVMLYTNKKGYKRFVQSYLTGLPLWICSFSNPPIDPENDGIAMRPWVLWQHSHKGSVKGIAGDVDINTFNGDSTAFANWLSTYSHDYNPALDF